jgi:hypothetical protein
MTFENVLQYLDAKTLQKAKHATLHGKFDPGKTLLQAATVCWQ